MKKIKQIKGITLVSLIITIIILLILAGVAINAINNTNLIAKSESAVETSKKKTAEEIINLKITNIQISNYVEKQKMPTLQELADVLCEDDEMEYVLTTSKNVASLGKLDKIQVGEANSIFTKLKAYPYEFEINKSLQLASIDGVKVSSVPTNDNDTIVSMTKAELDEYINKAVESRLADELEYKPGDTITYTGAMNIPGFISGSAKQLRGTLFLDKKVSQDVTSITFSTGNFYIRVENKYLITGTASSSSTYNLATYFEGYCKANAIYFKHDAETAFGVTNNSPISIVVENLTITFN